eukprot:508839-Rhodomonas_salina.5
MGIGLGFRDDGNDPPRDLDRISLQIVQERDNQIHRSSLCMNPAYSDVMELLQDEHLSDMKESRASLSSCVSRSAYPPLFPSSHGMSASADHFSLPAHLARGQRQVFLSSSSFSTIFLDVEAAGIVQSMCLCNLECGTKAAAGLCSSTESAILSSARHRRPWRASSLRPS